MSKSASVEAVLVDSATLEALVRATRGGNDVRVAELERIRFKRVSWWWCLGIAMALVSTVGYYDKTRYVMAALNFVAFLCFWRAMYVENNSRYNAVGTLICLLSIVMSQ